MKKLVMVGLSVLATVILFAPALGDDLSGATAVLCSSSWAAVCTSDEVCESGPPWAWNIPQFVELDLKTKTLSTTEASGENRTTPVDVVRREQGLIFVQGMEQDRAFSIVVSEKTGRMSMVIVAEDLTVSGFGACTPMPSGR